MLRLHHSNRLETLAGVLAEQMRTAPGDPFEAERIVVAHPSMGRWLALELAAALGIAANLRFELPAAFAWSIMRAVVPGIGGERAYTPARLRWRLYDLLPDFAAAPGAPSSAAVRDYLAGGGARERFELADRLARVFDRCLLYRPEWIREWARSPPAHWQARLWQRLLESENTSTSGIGHWVASVDAFRRAIGAGRPAAWPRRASFFAVPALSPSYLEVLYSASECLDLDIYLLNPCREYWGDIYSPRESRLRAGGADPGERYFSAGNELLAAWGRAGRDMIDAFIDAEAAGAESNQYFDAPEGPSRLAAVQRDILDLRLAGETAESADAAPAPDDSIQIHVCHSAIREAEVLHDRLLGLFDTCPQLQPADVLVLVADLGRYGPAIEAVFAAVDRIPFTIARVRASDARATRAFLDLLALPRSRYPAEAVLAPLEAEAVRTRYGLKETDLPLIRTWVREAGIRWGIDAAHRAAEGLPETAAHSWRQGMRRLLLGYAVGGEDDPVAGLVPCAPAAATGFESGPAEHEALGHFLTYCEDAFELQKLAVRERSAESWAETLREQVARFFTPAPGAASPLADEVREVHELIRAFAEEAKQAASPLSFEIVRDALRERADEVSTDAARLADGVTIARLAPGSIFPAQVVCVAGMNSGEFPRSQRPPSFDLVAAGPARRGDRDPRHEDRLAFLEALCAARRAFLVSYAGRGLRDDAVLPPSVVVDELRDYLARRFPGVEFETSHPLQPFSPRYFAAAGAENEEGEGGGLFSYSAGMCRTAQTLLAGQAASDPVSRFSAPLLPPHPSPRRILLSELIAFFAHPTRYFLRNRLGLRLDTTEEVLEENEPFEVEGLERYHLRTRLWEGMRAGVGAQGMAERVRGGGRLPQGTLGRVVLERAWKEVEGIRAVLAPHRDLLSAPPLSVDVEIAGHHLAGEMEYAKGTGLLWWRIGSLRAQDRIEIRLRQLALGAALRCEAPATAITLDSRKWKSTTLAAPKRAEDELRIWLDAWRAGLSEPLPFFPRTSWAYAEIIAKKGEDAIGEAREKAEYAWFGGYTRGEGEDAYLRLVYEDRDPLTPVFQTLASALLAPFAAD